MRLLMRVCCSGLLLGSVCLAAGDDGAPEPPRPGTNDAVQLTWSFEGAADAERLKATAVGTLPLEATVQGKALWNVPGPRPSEYPDFAPTNTALRLQKGPNYLVVADPGVNSPLDFTNGDALTLEAWVRWDEPLNGTYSYIIGKGRTHRGGKETFNQNYALRLANTSQGVFPTFLFADAENADQPGKSGDPWHRWTGDLAIPEDGGWHHVAITYVFGEPESIRAYVDGRPSGGKWDAGGPTSKPPVVDDDELWIGSSMAGSSTFHGYLDEVALHRRALSAEEIAAKVHINIEASGLVLGEVDPATVPSDHVRVEIMEGVPVARSWKFRLRNLEPLYETDVFALKELPRKYDPKGLIIDRPVPSLVHLVTRMDIPAGEYEFLVRSLDSARLYIDGELQTETPFMGLNGSAHGPYYEIADPGPGLLSVAAGHAERRVTVKLAAGSHVVSLYRLVGNKGKSAYLGETCVGFGPVGGPYRFLSPVRELPFTDAGWLAFLSEDETRLRNWEQQVRTASDDAEDAYWAERHAFARAEAGPEIPVPGVSAPAAGAIDRFILAKLTEAGVAPQPLVDDFSFLRRVTLDTLGVIPTAPQIEAFFADPAETRRARAIDRLLADPAWADHWVGYWQDVLAENPGLTKPELNNTGPFRWFLYESFLDNKPFDRFVTELVLMEGSTYEGGPAGFAVATQNDVPMAAKAHILGTAFLGVEMKCARCHDSPDHDLQQGDLFSLAAMLKRGAQQVPGTSSIPASPEQLARMQVTVSLKPGESVKPNWPFVELLRHPPEGGAAPPSEIRPLPDALVRNPQDTREQLAAQFTSPRNTRFAQVIVNRLWQRYLGRGIVEPVDDWELGECTHPELLEWLARELVTHDYDLKHVARLILNSETYQRRTVAARPASEASRLFAGPAPRRLTGEQLADSLHIAAGKDFGSEELTMDRDGRQDAKSFLHLGFPRRAWQFVAVANERDRPSLNLPAAQTVIDLMTAYGWRQQRQDPLTLREDALTPLQPVALAYGSAPNRVLDFSDGSTFTDLALQPQPLDQFIEGLFLRLLTRPPTSHEREAFVELLAPGYDHRIIAGPEAVPPRRLFRSGVTWSNHFDPKSDDEAIARQRQVLEGDRPSVRLAADWRARAEDAAWALVNLPEFVFVP